MHQEQFTFYTYACMVASLHPAWSGLFHPKARVGKLGYGLAHPGVVQQKEACFGSNVPRCHFEVSVNKSPTDQGKRSLKSGAHYSDAILKVVSSMLGDVTSVGI